ncbi:MAG: hypothetical protein Q8L48_13945 [Archangium sp.]|nr:hypothetical protein [Archangium sp.]
MTTASFSSENERLAKVWREQVELPGTWSRSWSQGGGLFEFDKNGEAGGFFVELSAFPGRRAYLKPIKRQHHRRAAREKLASDLAFELGVSVPPALLTINEKTADAERHVAVSLVMFPIQLSWGAIDDRLDREVPVEFEPMLMRVPAFASRALVMDTWLGQTDHLKPSNIVFGSESGRSGEGSLVFLDYAFSMGIMGGWDEGKHLNCQAAPFPRRLCDRVQADAVGDTIKRIEALSDEVITNIVRRIPFQWLREEEATPILTGLLARRGLLRGALEHYLKETP